MRGKWLNCPDMEASPLNDYFVESKLDLWIKYSDIIDDAHDRVRDLIMTGYIAEMDRLTLNRLIGALIFKCLSNNQFLMDTKFQSELKEILVCAVDEVKDKKEFFARVSDEIGKKLSQDESEQSEQQDNSLKADQALANFIKIVIFLSFFDQEIFFSQRKAMLSHWNKICALK